MADYKELKARLDRGETIIHDAAVSTELHSMGVPMDFVAWSGPSNYTHPSSIIQMHERHIRAGSDIITTNTWSTLRPTLERAGYGDFVREINARAVHLAQEARDRASEGRDLYIAGSLSSNITGRDPRTGEIGFGAFSATPRVSTEELKEYYGEVTSIMAEAGVDFFLVEAMGRDNEARIIQAQAAKDTGLPVWIGFNAYVDSKDLVMLGGQQVPTHVAEGPLHKGSRPMKDMTLAEAIREVLPVGPDVISAFHSRIASVNRAVQVALEEWPGPVMAYPDAGRQSSALAKWHDRSLTNEESIDDFTNAAKTWVNRGVQIIGACCEFGVEYIEPLRKSIPTKISHTRSITQ
ncbi:MAG: homocysteine S-methyltransferase family protein [SAR202 cluster bacterium]|nr:homocysteine S-methyltransferase family protein [SAR202 cluster bacterium]|tara:strand:- start:54 stop:1103 length:1050 start_codon:yes stop_codon:yes gene_type:complete